MELYVTDHSPDFADTGNEESLRKLYKNIRQDGFQSVRYDWRWARIEPIPRIFKHDQLVRYVRALKIMHEVGLEPPTIVLSTIPQWALRLYEEDRVKFFESYERFLIKIMDELSKAKMNVSRVQVLNELNNPIYCPVDAQSAFHMCNLTRIHFRIYDLEVKIMISLIAGNFNDMLSKFGRAKSAEDFLLISNEIWSAADVIAIDYYPGLWHLPLMETGLSWKRLFSEMEKLKEIFETIAKFKAEYELGETGLPTKWPWGKKRQVQFFQLFFESFFVMLEDFRKRRIALPSRIGIYEAVDEMPRDFTARMLRMFTPFPEFDMGLRTSKGDRKEILTPGTFEDFSWEELVSKIKSF